MKVYILTHSINRDDVGEVIADCSCYPTDILGVYATKEAAEDARDEAASKFFENFQFKDCDEEDEDEVRQQAIDSEYDIYAEDYPFSGVWGELVIKWDITAYEVEGVAEADGYDPAI